MKTYQFVSQIERPGDTRGWSTMQGKCVEGGDTRQWTTKHFDAANVPHQSLLALTPPQGEDNMHAVNDVNVRGPGESNLSIVFSHCGTYTIFNEIL